MKLTFFSITLNENPSAGPRIATVEFAVWEENETTPWVTYKVEFVPDDPFGDDLRERLKKQALNIVKSNNQYLSYE